MRDVIVVAGGISAVSCRHAVLAPAGAEATLLNPFRAANAVSHVFTLGRGGVGVKTDSEYNVSFASLSRSMWDISTTAQRYFFRRTFSLPVWKTCDNLIG